MEGVWREKKSREKEGREIRVPDRDILVSTLRFENLRPPYERLG